MIGSVLVMVGLFFLSISLLFLAFLLPAYQLKRLDKWGLRRSMLVHIIFMILLFVLQKELVFIYFSFTFCISIFYYLFYYFRTKENRNMDEIVVTVLVSTGLVLMFLHFFRLSYKESYELAMNIWKERYQLSAFQMEEIHEHITFYYPSMIFHYSMLLTFFTYLMICGMKKYRSWTLHYLWILPYVISVFLGFIVADNNFYLVNLEEISKGVLLWYGIKALYDFLADNFKKFAWILHGGSFLLALQYPNLLFIFGGVMLLADTLLKLKKEENDKEEN